MNLYTTPGSDTIGDYALVPPGALNYFTHHGTSFT
jgi:hypothetical protein